MRHIVAPLFTFIFRHSRSQESITPRGETEPAPPNPPEAAEPPMFIEIPPCDHVGLTQLYAGAGAGLPMSGPVSGVSE